ncbi:hypothetical protein [Mesorhizobium amorphae]|uniref:hypothetical protein n=1 Tax=Mesorhizobium amorphae TaxID=71433 RepID=UPI001428920D|nr:hypothetical protein [Mesorhizobium amorphae]
MTIKAIAAEHAASVRGLTAVEEPESIDAYIGRGIAAKQTEVEAVLVVEAEMLGGIEVHADGSREFIDVEMRSVERIEAVRNRETVMLGMGKLAGRENTEWRGLARWGYFGGADICIDDVVDNVAKRIQGGVDNRAVGRAANITARVEKGPLAVEDAGVRGGGHENEAGADRERARRAQAQKPIPCFHCPLFTGCLRYQT